MSACPLISSENTALLAKKNNDVAIDRPDRHSPSWRPQLLDRPNCIGGWGGLTGVSARRFTQNGLCRPLPVGSPPWGGLGPCPCQIPRPPEFVGVRWATWRRFDPSSSPSASLAAAAYSLGEIVGNRPNISSHFRFELRTSNRQGRLILLRMAHFSPELCTPRIWYGARNSSASSCL